jgi:uncharacterized membrane protein
MKVQLKKERIWELDFLRGFAILMVIVDHSLYDFGSIFSNWGTCGVAFLETLNNIGVNYMSSDLRIFWRPAFLFLFFVTSGLCTAFSRNNLIRSFRLGFVALLVSLVTYYAQDFFDTSTFVLFGVLHSMAVIIFAYSVVSILTELCVKLFYKLKKSPYNSKTYKLTLSVVCLILSVGFYFINHKYNVGLVDATGYAQTVDTTSKWLGLFFYTDNWWTADYFPLFPFICFFFFGAAISHLLYPKKKSLLPKLDGIWHTVFTFPGRHSLSFYLGGQIFVLTFGLILDAILI